MSDLTKLLEELERRRASMPPQISRKTAAALTGGIFSEKYLANLDSLNMGAPSVRIGRKRAYLTSDFIDWFSGRIQEING